MPLHSIARTPDFLLLTSVLAGLGLARLRPSAVTRWDRWWLGFLGGLVLLLFLLQRAFPLGMSYPKADTTRTIAGALEDLRQGIDGADCIVVFDGSSSSVYSLDRPTLKAGFEAKGHRPCFVYLVARAGEHLEREWMAGQLREAMGEELWQKADKLPLLWAKEMLWLYEGNPARFAAENRGTQRALACSPPELVPKTLYALWTDWRNARKNARWDAAETWEAFPADRLWATVNHGFFNLFQCGRLARLMDGPPEPLHVLDESATEPMVPIAPAKWADVPPPNFEEKLSKALQPRAWFKDLLEGAPEGWPRKRRSRTVLYMQPASNKSSFKYADVLELKGSRLPLPLFNGQADDALVERLHRPEHWKDTIHLQRTGAVIFSEWLVEQIEPTLAKLKPDANP